MKNKYSVMKNGPSNKQQWMQIKCCKLEADLWSSSSTKKPARVHLKKAWTWLKTVRTRLKKARSWLKMAHTRFGLAGAWAWITLFRRGQTRSGWSIVRNGESGLPRARKARIVQWRMSVRQCSAVHCAFGVGSMGRSRRVVSRRGMAGTTWRRAQDDILADWA